MKRGKLSEETAEQLNVHAVPEEDVHAQCVLVNNTHIEEHESRCI